MKIRQRIIHWTHAFAPHSALLVKYCPRLRTTQWSRSSLIGQIQLAKVQRRLQRLSLAFARATKSTTSRAMVPQRCWRPSTSTCDAGTSTGAHFFHRLDACESGSKMVCADGKLKGYRYSSPGCLSGGEGLHEIAAGECWGQFTGQGFLLKSGCCKVPHRACSISSAGLAQKQRWGMLQMLMHLQLLGAVTNSGYQVLPITIL